MSAGTGHSHEERLAAIAKDIRLLLPGIRPVGRKRSRPADALALGQPPDATAQVGEELITTIEFTLHQPLHEFDPRAFEAALRSCTGIDVSRVRIASIRSGSTKLELVGDPEVLASIVHRLRSSQDTLHFFARATGLDELIWTVDDRRYKLTVSPELAVTHAQCDDADAEHPATPFLAVRGRRFQVALSFPGERRAFVSQVADQLSQRLGQQRVFYDSYYEAELARPDLDLYLGRIYRDDSELVVHFYCADYERKKWCRLEWRQMRDILFNLEEHRIMPFRFDDTPIDGVLSIDGYVKIERRSPQEVAELILKRLAINKGEPIVARASDSADQAPPRARPVLFFSHSRDDAPWRERLLKHLRSFERTGLVTVWQDGKIAGGDDWSEDITAAMDAASLAIFLVSPAFLGSKFIQETEVPHLFARWEKRADGLRIFPILAEPCDWESSPYLTRVQMRPSGAKGMIALSAGTPQQQEERLAAVVKEIRLLLVGIESHVLPEGRPSPSERGDSHARDDIDARVIGQPSDFSLTAGVTLLLRQDFDSFGDAEKEAIVLLLSRVLSIPVGAIEVLHTHRGTVRFSVRLPEAVTDSLFAVFAEEGELRAAGVKTIQRKDGAGPRISVARLPITGKRLLGREDELAILDGAWADSDTHIVSVVAWGGVGKSALVNEWFARMARAHWRGAERVFAWTFYSQGTRDTAASADQFIAEALKWFGDPDPTAGSVWDKGERLARLVRHRRTLLLLDGLEPLQEPPHAAEPGRITDPALATLVRELTLENPGLCIITTRESVADLAAARHATTAQLNLAHLSTDAGVALLRNLGVQGTDDECRRAVHDVRGHALTLTLLGKYLAQAHGGDIRKRDEVKFTEADAEVQGGHAFKVMQAYENWFAREGEKGRPLIAILRLLGLFDHQADAGSLVALRRQPAIADLTESLVDLTDAQWSHAISRLASCGLAAENLSPSHLPGEKPRLTEISTCEARDAVLPPGLLTVDAHPLLREHFGEQVRRRFPDAWKEGHNRLYEHLKQAAPDLPDTLEEMMPLFAAVAHGCLAGRHQEACDEVYWRRICRGSSFCATRKLGAFGSDLAAISAFFEHLWDKPEPSLSEATQAWLLNEAGFDLRALGRLVQAVQPMQAGLDARIVEKSWKQAAISAGNLSELGLALGRVAQAQRYGRQGVELADRSGERGMRMINRTTLADALHQGGRLEEAKKALEAFREAEAMQKESQPQYPLLYSVRGYKYCDLLLSRSGFGLWLLDGRRPASSDVRWAILARSADAAATAATLDEAIELCREVQKRAEAGLEIVLNGSRNLLDIALNHLSLGRVLLLEHCLTGEASTLTSATEHLNGAVDGLRQSGNQDDLPRGLLARAALRRVIGDPSGAAHDLAEVQESAQRSGMRLFQVDALIEEACQQMAKADAGSTSNETTPPTADWKTRANECVAQAKALIE